MNSADHLNFFALFLSVPTRDETLVFHSLIVTLGKVTVIHIPVRVSKMRLSGITAIGQ
jgi:hypothetical protein